MNTSRRSIIVRITIIITLFIFLGNVTGNDEALFITISSTGEWEIDSYIELNWNFPNENPPNEIHLIHEKNPKPLITLNIDNITKGYFVTNITMKNISLPGNWQEHSQHKPIADAHCLKYSIIATTRDKQITHKNCLKIQPTWMQDNGNQIGHIPINRLFIPGTHNSGCYDSDTGLNFNIGTTKKFIMTQSVNTWTQLVFGIRYFDIRIGYYNTTLSPESFWINHDKFRVNPLLDFLQTIKQFLSKAPNEVIIIDIHRFPVNFNNERHKQLKRLLEKEFGNLILPRHYQSLSKNLTLNQIWKQERRIILCYNDEATSSNSIYFWDQLNQNWGDVRTKDQLQIYLEIINSNHTSSAQNGNNNELWAAMAELTPDATFVLLSILSSGKSVGYLAESVNRDLTYWYRINWCLKANIVATDYFLGNDIINVAIHCNLRKAKM